jgi:hypothetical protein
MPTGYDHLHHPRFVVGCELTVLAVSTDAVLLWALREQNN